MCCASPCPACSHVFLSFRDRRRGCNPRARHGRTHMYITPHLASFFNFDTQTMAYGCAVVWTGVARVQQRHRNRPPGSLPSSELGNDTGNPPGGSFHHQTRVVESRCGLYSNPTQTPAGSQENSAVSVSGKLVAYYPPVYTPHTQQRSARRRPIAQGHRVAPLATPYRSSPVPILARPWQRVKIKQSIV